MLTVDCCDYTSSKKQPAMLYTMVSHKADKEVSEYLIYYLKKKTPKGRWQKKAGKKSLREEKA